MENIREILLKSFDTSLTPEEERLLADALSQSEELREEKKAFEQVREMMAAADFSFNEGFTDRVIENIQEGKQSDPQMVQILNIFKHVAITGAAAIIALLIAIYFIDGSLATDTLMGISDYAPEIAELSFFENEGIE
jgi:hypothetical protein